MSIVTERTTEREREQVTGPPLLIHRYPRYLPYHLSGNVRPQPGDIALCGWVKRLPHQPAISPSSPRCVVCLDLAGRS